MATTPSRNKTDGELCLIPALREALRGKGRFVFCEEVCIAASDKRGPEDRFAATLLQEEIHEALQLRLRIAPADGKRPIPIPGTSHLSLDTSRILWVFSKSWHASRESLLRAIRTTSPGAATAARRPFSGTPATRPASRSGLDSAHSTGSRFGPAAWCRTTPA